MPSRRGLLAASAWTVPAVVLASSAPAFAGSGDTPTPTTCVPTEYVLNWADSAWTAAGGAAASAGAGVARGVMTPARTPVVAVQVTRSFSGGMEAHGDATTGNNMQVSPGAVGATSAKGLTLYQRHRSGLPGQGSAAGQTLTFTFPEKPVKGLTFTITDIDGSAGQFQDCVSVSLTPSKVVHATRNVYNWWGGVVRQEASTKGAGIGRDPFTSVSRSAVDNGSSDDGNVEIKFHPDVAIDSFSITFWNGVDGRISDQGQQAIYLSNMRFITDVCE